MRRTLLPAALVVVASLALAGCGTQGLPTPTPSATGSPSPTPSAPIVEETSDPTTVAPLPSSALLRLSVTAVADGQEVDLVLTFARAAGATSRPVELATVLEECPNAISSQLEILPGFEPIGVVTAELTTSGDWPDGLQFAVATGGQIAAVGDGIGVAPTEDPEGLFGCTVPIVTGPGSAEFISLLVGDPALPLRTNLDTQVAGGLFGFETDAGSIPVRWTNCIVQLSAVAERFAEESGWVLPAEWGDGCLIGDGGSV